MTLQGACQRAEGREDQAGPYQEVAEEEAGPCRLAEEAAEVRRQVEAGEVGHHHLVVGVAEWRQAAVVPQPDHLPTG